MATAPPPAAPTGATAPTGNPTTQNQVRRPRSRRCAIHMRCFKGGRQARRSRRGGRANELAIPALIRWVTAFTILACLTPSDGPDPSGSRRLVWRCHCGGHNPNRTCDAAKVSTRAAKGSVPLRLPRRIAPAIKPQEKPRRKNLRARRLFLRATADAMTPHVGAITATATSRAIRCVGPNNPISQPPGRRLRGPLARSNHRLRRTSIAGTCCYQSEHEALAARISRQRPKRHAARCRVRRLYAEAARAFRSSSANVSSS